MTEISTLSGQELAELSPMELMCRESEQRITERELELLKVIHLLKGQAEHYEAKYERQIEVARQLRHDLSEAESGLKLPGWARS